MSNTNSPFGFRWLSMAPGGGPANCAMTYPKIAYGDTTAIYRGDPVQQVNTGYVAQSAAAVAVSQVVGIFWGCEYLSNSLGRRVFSEYWPGSDCSYDVTAHVIPLIGATPSLWMVQATLDYFTFADIGMNCDIDIGTGSVSGGHAKSGCTLDDGTINTTATLPFRIVDLYSSIAAPGVNGIDDTSNYNIAIVRSNSLGETGI